MHSIPTMYRGIQMRSRLEAKWAAYFDGLETVEWIYEPFDLQGWIPDFLLLPKDKKIKQQDVLVEVKPITQPLLLPETRKIIKAIKQDEELLTDICCLLLCGLTSTYQWYYERGKWYHSPGIDPSRWATACNIVQWKRPK